MGTSYGLIEIPSTTAAIDVLDIMCKTADVEFVTWEKKLGGRLVTIIVEGEVSAVCFYPQSGACTDQYRVFFLNCGFSQPSSGQDLEG